MDAAALPFDTSPFDHFTTLPPSIQLLVSHIAPVHLCLVQLDNMPAGLVESSVSESEVGRAATFAGPRARANYLAAHAALRIVLSGFVHTNPPALQFATGKYGKPFLAQQNAPGFNMSHSENWALIGVEKNRNGPSALELGVDVEVWRDVTDAADMLTHIGSPQELVQFNACPVSHHASHAFLDLWTRKEACMKAVGTGLQWDPRSIEVGHMQLAVELDAWHEGRKRRLCVDSLDLGRYGLSAAVAFLTAD